MQGASRNLIALVVMSVSAGCYHYTADIPGVLDTRSDGSTAEPSPPALEDPKLTRAGLGAVISGAGVHAEGAQLSVEDRHFFAGVTLLAPGVFLLSNESAKEELEAALGDDALREVRVGHRYAPFDILLSAATYIVPCVPLLLAPQAYTFTASGERVAAAGQPPTNRPVAPPVDVRPPPAEVEPPPNDAGAPLLQPDDTAKEDAAGQQDDAAPSDVGGAP